MKSSIIYLKVLAAFLLISLITGCENVHSGIIDLDNDAQISSPSSTPTLIATETPGFIISPTIAQTHTATSVHTNSTVVVPNAQDIFSSSNLPVFSYKIINTYPHDRTAFTQGLYYDNEVLFESTGRYGQSTLRKVELKSGKILKIQPLPSTLFGEGLTSIDNRLIQLTWKSGSGFIYDKDSFEVIRQFVYPSTEGWGLTHDENCLIMSDGSAYLTFFDADTTEVISHILVNDDGKPIHFLNELEYVEGKIMANIWKTDLIVQIDPSNGSAMSWIDLKDLLSDDDRQIPVDVLNGIAYNPDNQHLLVTGKLYPKIYEIELVERQ